MLLTISMPAQTVVRSLVGPVPTNSSPSEQMNSSQTTTTSKTGQVEGVTSPNDNLTPMQKLQKEHSQGGIEFACNGWSTANGVDMVAAGNWWYGAIGARFGEKNEYVKDNAGFRFSIGTHKRYHLTNWLYLDGRIGIGYEYDKLRVFDGYKTHVTYMAFDTKYSQVASYSDMKNHYFLFLFRPCIGFNLFQIRGNDFSIFLAYEGNAFNFKSYGNQWSTGISFGM